MRRRTSNRKPKKASPERAAIREETSAWIATASEDERKNPFAGTLSDRLAAQVPAMAKPAAGVKEEPAAKRLRYALLRHAGHEYADQIRACGLDVDRRVRMAADNKLMIRAMTYRRV